jgi:hypothetical protein
MQVLSAPTPSAPVTLYANVIPPPASTPARPIDGAGSIEFLSNAPRLNDTREVWFIHGGFLYEITTYKELDA